METVTLKLITKKGEDFCKDDLELMLNTLKEGKTGKCSVNHRQGKTYFTITPNPETIKLLEDKLNLIR